MKKKECPSCAMEVEDVSKVCPICGYEFVGYSSPVKWLAVLLLLFSAVMLVIRWLG